MHPLNIKSEHRWKHKNSWFIPKEICRITGQFFFQFIPHIFKELPLGNNPASPYPLNSCVEAVGLQREELLTQ